MLRTTIKATRPRRITPLTTSTICNLNASPSSSPLRLRKFSSLTSQTRMAPFPSPLSTVQPPVSTALPADSYQLLPTAEKTGDAEDALFEQQIKDVEAWWKTPRFEGITRPYSARDVVSKRGSLQQIYPSSLMARKLFQLLNERAEKGEPIHTSMFLFYNKDIIKGTRVE